MIDHMTPNVPRAECRVQCGWLGVQPVSGRTAAGCSHHQQQQPAHIVKKSPVCAAVMGIQYLNDWTYLNKHFEPVLVCCGFFLTVR